MDRPPLKLFSLARRSYQKTDMPGSQAGVDLRFNKPTPMDSKDYSGRIKQFGTAIRKGDTARVTAIVVKKNMIEFQLDGGGFDTFGEDTSTKLETKNIENSDYEKDLEKQISETTDGRPQDSAMSGITTKMRRTTRKIPAGKVNRAASCSVPKGH